VDCCFLTRLAASFAIAITTCLQQQLWCCQGIMMLMQSICIVLLLVSAVVTAISLVILLFGNCLLMPLFRFAIACCHHHLIAVAWLSSLDCHCLIAVTWLPLLDFQRLVLPLLGIAITWYYHFLAFLWLDIHVALCCSCFVLLSLGGVGGAFAIAISIAAVASLSSIENIIPGTWYHVW